ncbi:MAG: hypothetical protein NT066_06845 [Candidatus Omnitrophica bacterium]|nr:hypothetical protein [Candidatus Omnitrophota bacterium]
MGSNNIDKLTKSLPDWQKILNPDIVKSNLTLASLYLSAYELLRDLILGRIKNFFSEPSKTSTGWDIIPSKEYKDEVLCRAKNVIHASCLWLKKMNAINEDDIKAIQEIRRHRNEIAHELPKLLVDNNFSIDVNQFLKIRELLTKIERWWIIEFEMAINEDFDNIDVEPEKVLSGPMILLDHLIVIATKGP